VDLVNAIAEPGDPLGLFAGMPAPFASPVRANGVLAQLRDLTRSREAQGSLNLEPFYGHRPDPDGGSGPFRLPQWFTEPFSAPGSPDRYATAEHFMMAAKARLFGDEATRERVLAAATPAGAKALGRQVRGFDQAVWERWRFAVVVAGSWWKFSTVPALSDYLASTRGRLLLEAAPHDRVWGVGLPVSHPGARIPSRWQGLNLLGFALIAVRTELAVER
jgi:ribA/ribD-fused uncharacterized protein